MVSWPIHDVLGPGRHEVEPAEEHARRPRRALEAGLHRHDHLCQFFKSNFFKIFFFFSFSKSTQFFAFNITFFSIFQNLHDFAKFCKKFCKSFVQFCKFCKISENFQKNLKIFAKFREILENFANVLARR